MSNAFFALFFHRRTVKLWSLWTIGEQWVYLGFSRSSISCMIPEKVAKWWAGVYSSRNSLWTDTGMFSEQSSTFPVQSPASPLTLAEGTKAPMSPQPVSVVRAGLIRSFKMTFLKEKTVPWTVNADINYFIIQIYSNTKSTHKLLM